MFCFLSPKKQASTVSEQDCISRLEVDGSADLVPGLFAVGTIRSLGPTVSSYAYRRSDRVAVVLPKGGGNARYVSVPTSNLIKLGDDDTRPDIVCLVGSYMTAYQCLKLAKKDGLPLTNRSILVIGGSTPVGQAMVELARREGAHVYTTAHRMHEEHLRRLGATWFPNKPKRWLPHLEGRMDAVIDMLCVDGYESSYRALNPDGRLICTGGPSSMLDPDSTLHVGRENSMTDEVSNWWSGVKARHLWSRAVFYDVFESYEADRKGFAHELSYLVCQLKRGEIKPKVAGRVCLNQVPKAQKLVERGLPNGEFFGVEGQEAASSCEVFECELFCGLWELTRFLSRSLSLLALAITLLGTVICLPWKKLDPKQNVRVESHSNLVKCKFVMPDAL